MKSSGPLIILLLGIVYKTSRPLKLKPELNSKWINVEFGVKVFQRANLFNNITAKSISCDTPIRYQCKQSF